MSFIYKYWTVLLHILIILVQRNIGSEVISGTFKVTKVAQFDYGFPIDLFYTSGITLCFSECQRDVSCKSVVYDKENSACKTNMIALLFTSFITSSDPSARQYYYIGKVKAPTIRNSCSTNNDCLDLNSECRDGICKCYYGLSYASSVYSCTASCSTYGTTFQTELSRYISGHNEEVINNTTDSQCRTFCFQATGFICRTYEFDYSDNTCYLQSETATTIPLSESQDYILYTRDCG